MGTHGNGRARGRRFIAYGATAVPRDPLCAAEDAARPVDLVDRQLHPRGERIERLSEAFRGLHAGAVRPRAGGHPHLPAARRPAGTQRRTDRGGPGGLHRRLFVDDGGLVSYGYDLLDQFRRAATYVDRILKGEKPSDLPVQAPTKYDLVINLKAAKALSLEIPPTVLARADEVIE